MAKESLQLMWLQSGGCGGCSLSLLCAENPDLYTALASHGIELLWHPALSVGPEDGFLALLQRIVRGEQRLDILCLEGAVMTGPNGTGAFHRLSGSGRPMMAVVKELAALAGQVVAVGSCAAYGGVTAGGGNHTQAVGLHYVGRKRGGLLGAAFRARQGLPVINVAGCPTHPNWVLECLAELADGSLTEAQLDPLGRPRAYTDTLVHHGCPRNEFYEYKASAEKLGQLGCLMEHLGCLGTQAHADCNLRLWNGEGSCLRGGYPCINCTAPGFQEPGHAFTATPKVAGIPVGLPTDMPKAWFVALASLSKAATPKRLRDNALAEHIVTPPATPVERP
ncbi:NADH ubiquinone oxidoreductase, 20 kDa subunit [Magnetococcus marinus MC-1]|uniref:hydrogenase (acceptor) n=1 Tax=Magnetococcus marinus (strain ATCC BAA-1437 / JCM 17883 / MC-1) TaxID=156889 RepID=A0LAK1_MAGMM|nr:NADH ubiquinone dehydrogenase [Magnetococcus marinus]ABK44994.1 NADH ubiquinone oxidoreductase, 20 kDa subunit [Magnetococcus marinus MC-1]